MEESQKSKSLLVIVVGLMVLYFITDSIYFLYASLGIGLISLIFPIIGDWILKIWFKIGEILGFINTRIILGAIFFVFLTPFAFLQKILTKGNNLKLKKQDQTVYVTRDHNFLIQIEGILPFLFFQIKL